MINDVLFHVNPTQRHTFLISEFPMMAKTLRVTIFMFLAPREWIFNANTFVPGFQSRTMFHVS